MIDPPVVLADENGRPGVLGGYAKLLEHDLEQGLGSSVERRS
jgi:hypothetical protein